MLLPEEAILGGPVYMRWIDHWRRRHSDKDGNFHTRENETLYVSKVFPNTRTPPISRPIDGELSYQTRLDASTVVFGNLDSRRSQPHPGYCTREQLEDLKRQHALEKEEQRKEFESQQNTLKILVDFFNRQQGTSSSQFQIPDLYTPQVFPGFISTPGGPSSTSPSPSSTPLGLGNCYTPTFDPETSQSDEQEDNDNDDSNHEYDVDIYDDE
ncbi:hypothetical protein Tco_1216000 [Tanacetum coccineum]